MSKKEKTTPGKGAPGTPDPKNVVTGHRLVREAERFVVAGNDGEPEGATPAVDDSAGIAETCPHCRGTFAAAAWEENGEYCPGCNRDENGVTFEPAPEMSEAEMLLQSIANDDEFSLRVDRLTNYEHDPRTDTRAARTFCTTLKPVTLDYLDLVRRSYGGGAYLFSMYKKGRGLVKVWHEVIEKQPQAEAVPLPPPTQQAVPPSAPQPTDRLRDAFETAMIRRLTEEIQSPARELEPAASPASPTSSLDELDRTVDLVEKITSINEKIHPPASGSSFFGDLALFMNALGVKDFVVPLITKAMSMPMPAGPTPGQPQLSPGNGGADTDAGAWQTILGTLINELQLNRRSAHTADIIEEHARKFPNVRTGVVQLFALSNDDLLAWIAAQSQVDLRVYPHCEEFLNVLRECLVEFVEGDDEPDLSEPGAVATGSAVQPTDLSEPLAVASGLTNPTSDPNSEPEAA